jgi:predicted phage terminase large subunit-like protein
MWSVAQDARKILQGSGYAGQHQQRPAPDDGNRFKKAWWRFWKADGMPDVQERPEKCYAGPARVLPTLHRIIISLDATFKDTDGTDFVVFQVWGTHFADRFLLDQSRARRSFTATLVEFKRLCVKWPHARRKLVEDKANGSAVIDTLKSKIAGIIAVNPEGGKESRAAAVSPEIESGNTYLPDGAPWLDDFVTEFAVFPNGSNDDQVDAASQALLDLSGGPTFAWMNNM